MLISQEPVAPVAADVEDLYFDARDDHRLFPVNSLPALARLRGHDDPDKLHRNRRQRGERTHTFGDGLGNFLLHGLDFFFVHRGIVAFSNQYDKTSRRFSWLARSKHALWIKPVRVAM
jgi:hypothetical protein